MEKIQYYLNKTMRLLIMCAMISVSCKSMAQSQSSAEKLYHEGIELQKVMTIDSQNSAISKFGKAKTFYDSQKMREKCDRAIEESNKNIKRLSKKTKSGPDNPRPKAKPDPDVPYIPDEVYLLNLSNEKFQWDYNSQKVVVTLETNEDTWEVNPIANTDGSDFVKVTPLEDHKFEIICPDNTTTHQRNQRIEVRAGSIIKEVVIEQMGIPTFLAVENSVVEFSSRGGSKSIEVYSDADIKISENNNRNWEVISKPKWVSIIGEEKKKKGLFGKIKDKVKSLVVKTTVSVDNPNVVTSVMKLVATSKSEHDPSRSGEVVIGSEDQRATIVVHQK